MIHVDIINASTVLKDIEIAATRAAFQKQVNEHFYPSWGVRANLFFIPKGAKPKPGHWWMVVMDNSDVSGALGYHDLTSDGLPIGKVFAATDNAYGLSWTVTLSHELVEMLADPDVNLAAQVSDTQFYSYESADAVEADELGYLIDGVLVSDFVTPEWFENMPHPKGTKFDHAGHLTRPLELAPGGYISVLNLRASQGWTQLTAQTADRGTLYAHRPKVGSRRERRLLPREQWLKSTA